jgi:hypothetical protein
MLKWGQKTQQVQQIIEIMHSHHLAHWESSSTSDSLIAKPSQCSWTLQHEIPPKSRQVTLEYRVRIDGGLAEAKARG